MGHLFELIFAVVPTLLWLWALWHCLRNQAFSGGTKFLWLAFIFFTHVFGAIIYFIFAPKRRAASPYYRPQQQQPYYRPSRQQQPYYQPSRTQEPYYRPTEQPSAAQPEEYQSYQQGYARRADPPAAEQAPTQPPAYNPYEYPHATYPEQTQQQQQ
ncbi:PLD nuclease N-terminal domain-containing protein [Dictyobacter kobayashii]|uniref:Cardiolipin synthase N-terminal domain-containing protein n=1 Tax=Dictyobacter kobayashii TaxID=2014872 RepID=A0A402AYV0_9CHLR|nr:PLD nuclease N-terminal domain-containing protein [Dictyobacter kobayashii]GCE24253.1 hypothetical protein KDK_80530 [Dictyobacter kobayashii]